MSELTKVLLVRHGHTPTTGKVLPGRAKGLYLSDKGINQAACMAICVKKITSGPTHLYASPMERTIETAAAVSNELNITINEEEGLLETDYGDWTGAELATLYKHQTWPQLQSYPSSFTFPNGESMKQMQTRFTQTIHALVNKHKGETVIAVAHADPIKAAVADALGTHLDLFQRIRIDPCSISAILYSDTKPLVSCVNSSSNEEMVL